MTDEPETKAAPEALRAWRENHVTKLTYEGAGRLVGVSGSCWFDWEKGTKVPSVDLAEDLEKATDGAVTVAMWAEISRERRLEHKAERDRKAAGGGG